MKKQIFFPHLDFSRMTVINNHIQEDHGINDLFAMMVNGLMFSERSTFLNDNQETNNKGN